MKVTKSQLKQFIKEELEGVLLEQDFSSTTGLPITAAGIQKCIQNPECKKRLYPPLKSFIDQFEKTLATIIPDEWLVREIKNIIWGIYVEGQPQAVRTDSQLKAMVAMMQLSPSSAATPAAATPAAATGADSGGAQQNLMKGIERTEAAMKKTLANPNLTPEEREEEKRDFEEDLRDLQDELEKLRGK